MVLAMGWAHMTKLRFRSPPRDAGGRGESASLTYPTFSPPTPSNAS